MTVSTKLVADIVTIVATTAIATVTLVSVIKEQQSKKNGNYYKAIANELMLNDDYTSKLANAIVFETKVDKMREEEKEKTEKLNSKKEKTE